MAKKNFVRNDTKLETKEKLILKILKGIEPEQKKTWKKDKLPMKSGFYASFLFFSCFLGVLGILYYV
ncbi:hypothetical protein [Streptococcus sobrinus]|uniref:Uncharacterized protein n=1 Tax=Streptococcus sobrinus W1703 TaxID=1227275 RepID=U2JEL9_9STRE|nr:hypothetical protein [Streptococcus sobrinus]ERJ78245.1 hypothetical protein HMPREF1557_00345 [Streptococcus sobrinus W1703]